LILFRFQERNRAGVFRTKRSRTSPLEFILPDDAVKNLLAGGVADLLLFAHLREVGFVQMLPFSRGFLGARIFFACRRCCGLSAGLAYTQAQANDGKTGYSNDRALHFLPRYDYCISLASIIEDGKSKVASCRPAPYAARPLHTRATWCRSGLSRSHSAFS
jgi:hypothetical protein